MNYIRFSSPKRKKSMEQLKKNELKTEEELRNELNIKMEKWLKEAGERDRERIRRCDG